MIKLIQAVLIPIVILLLWACERIEPDPSYEMKFEDNPVVGSIGQIDTAYLSFNEKYDGQGKVYFNVGSDSYSYYTDTSLQILGTGDNYVVFRLNTPVSDKYLEAILVTKASKNSYAKCQVVANYENMITYHSLSNSSYTDIYAVSPDGSGKLNLTQTSYSSEKTPCLGKNGDFLIYASGSYLYNFDQSLNQKDQINYSSSGFTKVHLSGDGSRLSVSDAGNNFFLMSPDGYTYPYSFPGSGSFTIEASLKSGSTSSDCAYIRTDTKSNPGFYYLYHLNSSGIRYLVDNTTGSTFLRHVKISADGKFLVYEKGNSSFSDIYKVDLATYATTKLTSGSGVKTCPSIKPDGSKLVFSSNSTGNYDLYVLDLATTSVTNITNSNTQELDPHWN